jgi:hypothetical protein
VCEADMTRMRVTGEPVAAASYRSICTLAKLGIRSGPDDGYQSKEWYGQNKRHDGSWCSFVFFVRERGQL